MYDVWTLKTTLGFGGEVNLGVLGEAMLKGQMGVSALDKEAWFEVEGFIDSQIGGFCLAGYIYASSPVDFALSLQGEFGPFGRFSFFGKMAGLEVQVRAEIEASFRDFVVFFIEALIYLITGVELTQPDGSTNIVVDVIQHVVNVVLPFEIWKIAIDFDSTKSWIQLEIGFSFFSLDRTFTIPLPNPTALFNRRQVVSSK